MIKIRPDVIKIKDPNRGIYTSLLAIKGDKGDNGNIFAYPVGAIYMSVDPASPSELFGGSWERLEGRFLLGAGELKDDEGNLLEKYEKGAIGGSAKVKLASNELPLHGHTLVAKSISYDLYGRVLSSDDSGPAVLDIAFNSAKRALPNNDVGRLMATDEAGMQQRGDAHENMPPYLAVYMWKRIA